jgi:hypothetical protein
LHKTGVAPRLTQVGTEPPVACKRRRRAARGWLQEKLGIHRPSRVFSELGGFVVCARSSRLERKISRASNPLRWVDKWAPSKKLASEGVVAATATSDSRLRDSSPVSSRWLRTEPSCAHVGQLLGGAIFPRLSLHLLFGNGWQRSPR